MNDLTAQQIISWFRKQRNRFNQLANDVEQTFKGCPVESGDGILGGVDVQPPRTIVTPEELESALRAKCGRVKDLAQRLQVTESAIQGVLSNPGSRIFIAERGWLKIKEQE